MAVSDDRLGIIISMFSACCWGFSGTCSEYLFKIHQLDSAWLTMVRMLIAGLLLLSFSLIKGQRRATVSMWRNRWSRRQILLFAALGLMPVQYTYLAAISYTNSGTATILQYIGPVLVMAWACFTARRLPEKLELASIILVVSGVFLLATHGNIHSLVLSGWGLFWGLLSALALALHDIIPGNLLRAFPSAVVTGWSMLVGGIIFTVIVRPFHQNITPSPGVVLGLLGLILIGTVMGFSLFLYGLNLIGPVRASMVASIEPLSAALFSHFWLKTEFMPLDIISFAFILLAVSLITRQKRMSMNKQSTE